MTPLEQGIRRILLDGGKGRHAFGNAGEAIIMMALQEAGYKVRNAPKRKCGDLLASSSFTSRELSIEVKSARRGQDGNYRFCLTRDYPCGWTGTNHNYSDFTILFCSTRALTPIVFVIPSIVLSEQKNICISENSVLDAGKYHAYRQNINNLSLTKSVETALGDRE